jgi:hypothetical protein
VPTDNVELASIITERPIKATPLDAMPSTLLRLTVPLIVPILVCLTNNILQSGIFPTCLKVAMVTPIIKKPGADPSDLANFRPISNTSYFAKLVERVILKRLERHIYGNALLSDCQAGFRPANSTETAILHISNEIRVNFSRRRGTAALDMDMSAAFDLLLHSRLCSKLAIQHFITGTAASLLASFLADRQSCVVINGVSSRQLSTVTGVPQGCVLGPFLFNLYVNDLYCIISNRGLTPTAYADDTQISVNFDLANEDSLKQALHQLELCFTDDVIPWMRDNHMAINPGKSELIIFRNDGVQGTSSIIIGGDTIISQPSVKLLGVTLDSSLTMLPHVSSTCAAAYLQLKKISSKKNISPSRSCLN